MSTILDKQLRVKSFLSATSQLYVVDDVIGVASNKEYRINLTEFFNLGGQGLIPTQHSSGLYFEGFSDFKFDSVSKYLGIGTSTPLSSIDIENVSGDWVNINDGVDSVFSIDDSIGNVKMRLGNTGDTDETEIQLGDWEIRQFQDDFLSFRQGGTEYLRLSSSFGRIVFSRNTQISTGQRVQFSGNQILTQYHFGNSPNVTFFGSTNPDLSSGGIFSLDKSNVSEPTGGITNLVQMNATPTGTTRLKLTNSNNDVIDLDAKSGWTQATGTATRTSFDTATVTTEQLAERVKAMIDDFYTGSIGLLKA
jgi:hypothetical protein